MALILIFTITLTIRFLKKLFIFNFPLVFNKPNIMNPFTNTLYFFIVFFIVFLFVACENNDPIDVMFCKAQEVYVLEYPFDKKSAKIVIYRGDEVKLSGDTVYHVDIDSTQIDSSDFSVKVTAKRGVIGWVHINEIQKGRIDLSKIKAKPKKANAVASTEIVVKDSTLDYTEKKIENLNMNSTIDTVKIEVKN